MPRVIFKIVLARPFSSASNLSGGIDPSRKAAVATGSKRTEIGDGVGGLRASAGTSAERNCKSHDGSFG
jgi:hypothetical protein